MRVSRSIRRLGRAEQGVAAIEYAILTALLALVIIPALTLLGPRHAEVFGSISEEFAEASDGDDDDGSNSNGGMNINTATPEDLEPYVSDDVIGLILTGPKGSSPNGWNNLNQVKAQTGLTESEREALENAGFFGGAPGQDPS